MLRMITTNIRGVDNIEAEPLAILPMLTKCNYMK